MLPWAAVTDADKRTDCDSGIASPQETEGAWDEWLAVDVVCHELAHQWFGNLVTCSDWGQLAVNEGVATLMEYKCVEAAAPQMPRRALFQFVPTPMGEGGAEAGAGGAGARRTRAPKALDPKTLFCGICVPLLLRHL
jgi:Peptidase family M1 domain